MKMPEQFVFAVAVTLSVAAGAYFGWFVFVMLSGERKVKDMDETPIGKAIDDVIGDGLKAKMKKFEAELELTMAEVSARSGLEKLATLDPESARQIVAETLGVPLLPPFSRLDPKVVAEAMKDVPIVNGVRRCVVNGVHVMHIENAKAMFEAGTHVRKDPINELLTNFVMAHATGARALSPRQRDAQNAIAVIAAYRAMTSYQQSGLHDAIATTTDDRAAPHEKGAALDRVWELLFAQIDSGQGTNPGVG